jgi:HEAT repeats
MTLAPVFLAVATSLAAAAAAGAPPPADVRNEVRALLGSIHRPVSPETFRALGPGAEDALVDFAREANGPPLRRARALDALAGLGGARAEATHRDVAASASAPRSVRRTAVRGLGRLAGAARAPQELSPFLERDRDPTVRAAAAEALAAHAPVETCPRIRARARAEAGPARYARALAMCDRAAGTAPARK